MTNSQIQFARIIGLLEAFDEMHLPYDSPDVNQQLTSLPMPPFAAQRPAQPPTPEADQKTRRWFTRLNMVLVGLMALWLTGTN